MIRRDDEQLTRILNRLNDGDRTAWQDLLLNVDETLKGMAKREMVGERADHTLQATALISEAFLRLKRSTPQFENRAHFFGAAARAMQQTLVEAHRRRSAQKRGGDAARVPLSEAAPITENVEPLPDECEDLRRALTEMAEHPRLSRKLEVVRMLFFEGRSISDTAVELDLSESTVNRDWRFARAWLYDRLKPK